MSCEPRRAVKDERHGLAVSVHHGLLMDRLACRLQAVPFWIVERSHEIAEREKTGANERRGTWGEAGKRGKEKSLLVFFSSLQSR